VFRTVVGAIVLAAQLAVVNRATWQWCTSSTRLRLNASFPAKYSLPSVNQQFRFVCSWRSAPDCRRSLPCRSNPREIEKGVATTFSKLGGPISWSEVLLPFSRKKLERFTQFGAVYYPHQTPTKKLCKKLGSKFLGVRTPQPPPQWLRPWSWFACTKANCNESLRVGRWIDLLCRLRSISVLKARAVFCGTNIAKKSKADTKTWKDNYSTLVTLLSSNEISLSVLFFPYATIKSEKDFQQLKVDFRSIVVKREERNDWIRAVHAELFSICNTDKK